ncbi:MAG: DUF2267 domain-containing protein [Actinomycetota bacterium]|nr:DUF2267 domain-containing protein [Actinomycetota bacterium]
MTKRQFIEIVKKESGLKDRALAELATDAVLQTLHDRLTEGQAEHIESHLPEELKPLLSRGLTDRLVAMWRGPEKMSRSEFLGLVQRRAHLEDTKKSEYLTQGVFKALKKQIPAEEVENVCSQLPRDLKDLWKVA